MKKLVRRWVWCVGFCVGWINASAQEDSVKIVNQLLDSLYIAEVEQQKGSPKVLHAEPLYIDLIRDLGARKGESEWNVGLGLTDRTKYDMYTALVEYEWAPVNRLGLEVELPFSLYDPLLNGAPKDSIPKSKLNSLKLAAQYTFLVSERWQTSLALGYLHEFELLEFVKYGKENVWEGNLANPFFIAAKRWGQNFHTLVYTGPQFLHLRGKGTTLKEYQINTNIHYMISGTRNFIGVEVNKGVRTNDFDMVIRPQMRVGVTDHLLVGIVAGIPVKRETERFSSFLRIIYEPRHKHPKEKIRL